jgi:hypothetical protein
MMGKQLRRNDGDDEEESEEEEPAYQPTRAGKQFRPRTSGGKQLSLPQQ